MKDNWPDREHADVGTEKRGWTEEGESQHRFPGEPIEAEFLQPLTEGLSRHRTGNQPADWRTKKHDHQRQVRPGERAHRGPEESGTEQGERSRLNRRQKENPHAAAE